MEFFKLEVYFHAENEDDAKAQVSNALDAFDDGFEEAYLVIHPERGGAVMKQIHPGA